MATPKRERNPSPPTTTFVAAADRYVDDGGQKLYLDALRHYFGPKTTIGEIDKIAIDAAVQSIGPHLAKSSAHRQVVSQITVVLNHAFDTGRKRGAGNKPPRWLTPDEAEAVLDMAGNPERIGLRDPQRRTMQKIAFMLGTGAMPHETVSIKGAALDRKTNVWSLPGITSIVRPRLVLPPARAINLIGDVPFNGEAFLAPNGGPYVLREKTGGQMAEAFNHIRDAAGLGKDVRLRRGPSDFGYDAMISPTLCPISFTALRSKFSLPPMAFAVGSGRMRISSGS
ncbi:hypothetical protein ACOI1H_24770 [Loktanella sp. DJP18]|uniref:hypothetical protein n=1 Tax=Loktanella sp. DJP18 TaxID=3409788 RepID=UPI003BB4E216